MLTLERREQPDRTTHLRTPYGILRVTPGVNEDYWLYRVRLSETQAMLGFPKFGMVGIGFAREDDWNTNLPASCEAGAIFEHIAGNKGDQSISDDDCLDAIRMIQRAVIEDAMAARV